MRLRCDLLAIDLDGTLLDSQHRLPEPNRAALHRAHAAGIKIVICTGRAFAETQPILSQIGLDLDAAITVFGALLNDAATGRTLERRAIAPPIAHAATAWFRQLGYPVFWLCDRDEAGHDGYVLDGPRCHPAVDRWVALSPCRVHRVPVVPPDAADPVRLSIIDDTAALAPIAARLQAEFDGRLTHNVLQAPQYALTVIESFAAGVNKWYGVERLCQRWELDPRNTVAIGDDVNDVDMVRSAGLGVAMANAHASVQAVADRTTVTNDEHGVARVINELLG